MLANYAELQAEIEDTLHRNDLTAKIPTFISLFEKKANRSLQSLLQEQIAASTLLATESSIALPSGFSSLINVALIFGGIPDVLQQVSADSIDDIQLITRNPEYYNVRNSRIYFDSIAPEDLTINTRYIKGFDIATDLSNWLLLEHPDVYLYGSLAASSIYINDDRLGEWATLAAEGISEVIHQAAKTKGKTKLMTELADYGGYDISRGY